MTTLKNKKNAERKAKFETSSGIPLEATYTAANLSTSNELPGEYPFTRGIHAGMYRSRFWTMRQYAGFASAAESNQRYKYLLAQGQMGLSVAFDLPTQLCMDADDELARGEVGKVGVSISTLGDMRELFNGIPLDQVSTSMTINAPAAVLLALYVAVGKEQAAKGEWAAPATLQVTQKLRGTVQNDILKEYAARGLYRFPPTHSMRLVTDIFAFCREHVPQWNTISISGYHIREAGSTAVQEVAFTLANGIAYVQGALDAGLNIDDFARQLAFFFNAHNNFLEEVAKFRAARRMWAKIMRERFDAKDPRSWMLRFHTQTGGATLTAQQPQNNIARVTIQTLAAVLGGTQSLHTNGYDEALSLPTEAAARIALRTQQIVAYESGVADTADPLAGSYFVESLTQQTEQKATDLIRTIDNMGGSVAAIESGFMQDAISNSAYQYQKKIESGEQIIVGMNQFTTDKEEPIPGFKIDDAIRNLQTEKLALLRAKRDAAKAKECIQNIQQAAKDGSNLMPHVIEAVENKCTLGEIAGSLREIFGEYQG